MVIPKRMGCPGAAVSRGYTTKGVLPVSALSCHTFGSNVVMPAPATSLVFGPACTRNATRGPQPFLSHSYPGCGLITTREPGTTPETLPSTSPDVRLARSRIGELIS